MTVHLGSLADRDEVARSVDEIAAGGFVAVQYHGTFILIFSGTIGEARRRALAAKGEEDSRRPLSSLGFCHYLWPYIARERVPEPVLRDLLADDRRYRQTVGAVCHVRLPLADSAFEEVIPQHMVSTKDGIRYVQSLDPTGSVLFAPLAEKLAASGVPLLAATSLNRHGEEEIVALPAARAFCDDAGIPLLLHDPFFSAPDVKGAFPVIDLVAGAAVRDGHIPIGLVDAMIGFHFDTTAMRPAKHSQARHLQMLSDAPPVSGAALRNMVLDYLYRSVRKVDR